MMGKFAHDITGLRIGDALECAYSEKHEGCGQTIVCHQCGIRRVIDLARITDEKFSDIPLIVRNKSGIEQKLLFSFAKAADAILILLKSVSNEN